MKKTKTNYLWQLVELDRKIAAANVQSVMVCIESDALIALWNEPDCVNSGKTGVVQLKQLDYNLISLRSCQLITFFCFQIHRKKTRVIQVRSSKVKRKKKKLLLGLKRSTHIIIGLYCEMCQWNENPVATLATLQIQRRLNAEIIINLWLKLFRCEVINVLAFAVIYFFFFCSLLVGSEKKKAAAKTKWKLSWVFLRLHQWIFFFFGLHFWVCVCGLLSTFGLIQTGDLSFTICFSILTPFILSFSFFSSLKHEFVHIIKWFCGGDNYCCCWLYTVARLR